MNDFENKINLLYKHLSFQFKKSIGGKAIWAEF